MISVLSSRNTKQKGSTKINFGETEAPADDPQGKKNRRTSLLLSLFLFLGCCCFALFVPIYRIKKLLGRYDKKEAPESSTAINNDAPLHSTDSTIDESKYAVKVEKVRTINVRSDRRIRYTKSGIQYAKTNSIKKAVVKLAEGDSIDFYANS